MAAKTVSQKKFAKLAAGVGVLSQPPGAISRISNLTFNQRGSLQIADGSSFLSPFAIGVPPNFPLVEWLTLYINSTFSQSPYLVAISQAASALFGPPTGLTATPSGSTTNPPGTYAFGVVAIGSASGDDHTMMSVIVGNVVTISPTTSFSSVNFVWDPPASTGGIFGYQIYAIPLSGSFNLPNFAAASLLAAVEGPISNNHMFTGSVVPSPFPFPAFNNIVTNFYHTLSVFFPNGAVAGSNLNVFQVATANFNPPGLLRQPAALSPSDPNFSTAVEAPGFSPYGGIAGVVCPIPYAVQFAGKEILILGNGVPPQSFLPSSLSAATVDDLQNTFEAAFPNWQPSVDWTTGAQISVPNGPVNFLFTATQGGVSGTTMPSFNFSTGSETSDNSVVWTSNGPIPASVAPIGAAHGVAYAGSLWLANTYIFTTQFVQWSASTQFSTKAQIVAIDSSGNSWLIAAKVGGESGNTLPSFNFTVGATTVDNQITWFTVTELPPSLAAGIDGPSCLKMSDANNPNSWNPVNVAFIDADDGSQITGIQPFTIAALGISPTGSLCVFKEFTTYQVIGVFGSSTFEIQPAQTNLGCLAARSIQFLPGFGVCRWSHLGFAVFDGIQDRLISEDIRPYLFGGVDSEADLVPVDPSFVYLSQSAQTTNPPMYMCAMPLAANPGPVGKAGIGNGMLTRLFCYDLVMKAWTILDLPFAISALNTTAGGEGSPVVLLGKTTGQVERMQSGDAAWDTGNGPDTTPVSWSFRTPDVFGEGSSQKIFYEMVTIRGYGTAAMLSNLRAVLWLDGATMAAITPDIVPQAPTSNLFEARFSIFKSGYRAHLDVSGSGGPGTIDAADWAVSPKNSLARRVIS